MASDEARKKWGTIFMGDREASVEQLNAMQEPLLREKQQKDQAEDYMERVRAKAADRAREILGAAYAERQKVLDEARADAARMKKECAQECAKLRASGESTRQMAQSELDKATAELRNAEAIRNAAHEEGYHAGMERAAAELHEFRADLGQSLASILRALERERQDIMNLWRDDLVELVQCAAQAGSGFILQQEHEKILRNLVFQALDLLESRAAISLRVNPADEDAVSGMFKAARDRFPELKQWIVNGDDTIERGGLVAESGSGSVDLRRENFRDMVANILAHLALPEGLPDENSKNLMRELVEREVAHIASLTPEMDKQPSPAQIDANPAEPAEEPLAEPEIEQAAGERTVQEAEDTPQEAPLEEEIQPEVEAEAQPEAVGENLPAVEDDVTAGDPSLRELEEELFPLDNEPSKEQAPAKNNADPDALAKGGFV